jgi:4-hydroxybenzoate polyprenyltransferase
MTLQMRGLNVDDADSCVVTFRSNRNAGLLPALFLAAAALV